MRAGIAAALRRDGRSCGDHHPGRASAGRRCRRGAGRAPSVLVVDQCEEVFTLCDDPAERSGLPRRPGRSRRAGRRVVVALRADRLGEVSAIPAFARLVERGLYLLGAMGEDDLRAAIEGPAGQAGLLVEPGLVDLLVREVEGEPGRCRCCRTRCARPGCAARAAPDGRRLPGLRRHPRGGRPVRRGRLRAARRRPASRCCATCCCGWWPRAGGRAGAQPDAAATGGRRPGAGAADRAARRGPARDQRRRRRRDRPRGLARAWPRLRGWLDDDVEVSGSCTTSPAPPMRGTRSGRPDSELYRGAGSRGRSSGDRSPPGAHPGRARLPRGGATAAPRSEARPLPTGPASRR